MLSETKKIKHPCRLTLNSFSSVEFGLDFHIFELAAFTYAFLIFKLTWPKHLPPTTSRKAEENSTF